MRRRLDGGRSDAVRTLSAAEDGAHLGAALDDLACPLLFGGGDVLVIRHVELLDEGGQGRVSEAIERLGPKAHVVLVGEKVDMRRRLFAGCQRAGAAFGFPALSDRDRQTVRQWATRLARERGHVLATAACDELVDRTGPVLAVVDSEIEKLSLHAGAGARLEVTHVRAVVPATRVHVTAELTERIARHDAAGAVITLRRLLDDGEEPLRVLAFLAANLRRALHVAELSEAGLSVAEIAARLGVPAWLVEKSRGRHAHDLARALQELRRVDLALKRSRSAAARFEAAILAIAGAGSS